MSNSFFHIKILIFLLLFTTVLSAQIGVKGGIGISDIAFVKDGQTPYLGYVINSLEHRKPKLAYHVGAYTKIAINDRFFFQPEMNILFIGLDYSTEYLYEDITYKLNVNYLNFPLLFNYKTSIKDKTGSSIFIGPYISWKIKAIQLIEIDDLLEKAKVNNINSADFGLVVGISKDFILNSGSFVFDIRGSFSLINMMKPLEGHIPWYLGPSKDYARNVHFSFSVGYLFANLVSNKTK